MQDSSSRYRRVMHKLSTIMLRPPHSFTNSRYFQQTVHICYSHYGKVIRKQGGNI